MRKNDKQAKSHTDSMPTYNTWSFQKQLTSTASEYGGSFTDSDSKYSQIGRASELLPVIEALFLTQRFAVLSTQGDGAPYGNLVAFASADRLTKLIFVTPRATRKFSNILSEPRVALVIDNRSNDSSDFSDAIAVTATGRAFESDSNERERLLDVYLAKHPHLKEFARSPSCAIVSIDVDVYYSVYGFQNVIELHFKK